MRLLLSPDSVFDHVSFTSAIECVNLILGHEKSFCSLFLDFSVEYADDNQVIKYSSKELFTASQNKKDCVLQYMRDCDADSSGEFDCFLAVNTSGTSLFVDPDSLEDFKVRTPEQRALCFLFYVISLGHELCHIHTPIFNKLNQNSNSNGTIEDMYSTPPKLLRFVDEDGAKVSDSGYAWEYSKMGGVVDYDGINLSVKEVIDINTCAELESNVSRRYLDPESALALHSEVTEWMSLVCASADAPAFPDVVFRSLHFNKLKGSKREPTYSRRAHPAASKTAGPDNERDGPNCANATASSSSNSTVSTDGSLEGAKKKSKSAMRTATDSDMGAPRLRRKLFPKHFTGDKA